ncbi:hypothetical protein BDZ89DRAFT_1101915 [Hymenopellis radicata]|nr:hypothetical protein BDZ89DRAFT_1101915 [Hymenopellis radicata]
MCRDGGISSPIVFLKDQLNPRTASLLKHESNPKLYFNGRWDDAPGTWWAGSGLKLVGHNIRSLALKLGPHTTTPYTTIAISTDYGEFESLNVSEGFNTLPVNAPDRDTTIRINVEGWQNNRMNLESLVLNSDASLLTYEPSALSFLFIGDSLSAGQYLPMGINQAWPFLVGEHFNAEHTVIAQPGAALKDIVSYGNMHGMEFQFFQTEDTGYYYTTDHNYTTPWDFNKDRTNPTHIVIHIGANDASQNVTADDFVFTCIDFIRNLRQLYPVQPIFLFTPWGWPSEDGSVSYYYEGRYNDIVQLMGDTHVYLVDTKGWVTWDDIFPDNQHPNVPGHINISNEMIQWLNEWGLEPAAHGRTSH